MDQILITAKTCFLNNGNFATKMDAIAKESALSKGEIYFHFSSKHEIFKGFFEQEYDAAMDFIDRVI